MTKLNALEHGRAGGEDRLQAPPGESATGPETPACNQLFQPPGAGQDEPVTKKNRRILVIDDAQGIHEDFRKVLAGPSERAQALEKEAAVLFGPTAPADFSAQAGAAKREHFDGFEVDSAYQGEEGLELVRRAREAGRPYALAFVDVRMPPGWDGIETTARLWEVDPELQVVLCTAYSDYSWEQMVARLGQSDRLLILKKPFDNVEALQLAHALTEKWNLAQQAKRTTAELQEAVDQRTRELQRQNQQLEQTLAQLQEAHAQLLQADKMASIGQLAAGVAHEINNPIGFISSNLNSLGRYLEDLERVLAAHDELLRACLQTASGPADKARQVKRIREEADLDYVMSDLRSLIAESIEGTQRVRQIVSDLRDFSHVDSPDVTEEDINQLLDKTINVAWNELKYKAEVVRQYGQIPPIPCYGGKLGQVFLNLLVNAAQAIERRGTITIRTGLQKDHIWVEVADTGCGIPAENLQRIFEPFFTTKEVGKGTGMGLHLAYKIVEAHGGRISVKSAVGQGSTFRVELPLTGPPAARENTREPPAHA